VLREELGYTWHFIKSIDADGMRLNEGWFKGPFTPKTMRATIIGLSQPRRSSGRFRLITRISTFTIRCRKPKRS